MLKLLESGLVPTVGRPLTTGNRPLGIIILDSRISSCTIYDVDTVHRNNNLTMFAYHFFVNKNGSVYIGRPENTYAQIIDERENLNLARNKIVICLEGYYEEDLLIESQKISLKLLVKYLTNKYLNLTQINTLQELIPETKNPGIFFPTNEIRSYILDTLTPISVVTPSGMVQYSYGMRELKFKHFKPMEGNDIVLLQHYLSNLGFFIKFKNGIYDRITEGVVKDFQKAMGMAITGIVNEEVYKKIDELILSQYIKLDLTHYHRLLKYRNPLMQGEDIEYLKEKLNLFNPKLEINKVFDKEMEEVVIQFQNKNNINPDGIIGPLTFKYISMYSVIQFTRVLMLTDPMMEGEDVLTIQTQLQKLGLYKGELNGKYDASTKVAVIQYQTIKSIRVTGVVDEITFNLIMDKVV